MQSPLVGEVTLGCSQPGHIDEVEEAAAVVVVAAAVVAVTAVGIVAAVAIAM